MRIFDREEEDEEIRRKLDIIGDLVSLPYPPMYIEIEDRVILSGNSVNFIG